MNESRQIKIGVMISYGNIILTIIAGLVYTPWMIKNIGKSDYGLFALASSFLTYFILDFGLGSTIARFIAKYRVEKNEQRISELLGLTFKLYLIIDILILITLFILYFFIQDIFVKLSIEELRKFRVVYFIVGLFSIISFPALSLNGILIAYERFIFLKMCDLLNRLFTVTLMSVILIAGYKLYGLVLVNALIGIVIIVIKLFYLSKNVKISVNLQLKNKNLLIELFRFTIWVSIILLAQRLLLNITPTVLGIFSGTTQISIFAIGMTIEGFTWTFATAINGLFLPKVTQMKAENESKEEFDKLMIKVGRIQLFVLGIIIIGFISFGRGFILLWLGEGFVNSYYVALLLILPGIISLTQEIGVTLLFVTNEIKYRAILFIGASLISISLSVLLSPNYGAIGSAIGIFTALILCHVIGMNIVYVKKIQLNITQYFLKCHLKILFPLLLSLLAGFIIDSCIPANNLLSFFPKAILFGIAYSMIMWALGLNNEEKTLINSLAKGILLRIKITYQL